MKRLLAFALALVALAYGIRAGIDYFRAQEEKRLAEHRAGLIVSGVAPDGDVTLGMSMWHEGRRRADAPAEVYGVLESAYRRWLAEKGIRDVRSYAVIGSGRASESEFFGQSSWDVGVEVDGKEVWMRLVLGEQAAWVDSPP